MMASLSTLRIQLRRAGESIAAPTLIVAMLAIRLGFSLAGWPGTDSEEGTMGLMALHIARGQDWPIFYYGQNYMGAGEAYVAAVFFHLFGPSLLSLRLAMLAFLLLFALALYQLARLLYGRTVAIFSLVLLSLAPRYVLTPEMRAVGGAVETLAFGSLAMLLAAWLAQTQPEESGKSWPKRRLLASFTWGLVAGLGLWSHWLVIPFLGCAALLLVLFSGREWLRHPVLPLLLLAGLVLGAFPLILYNLHAPSGQDSLSVFLALYSQNRYPGIPPTGLQLWLKKLAGTFLYSLPLATGMTPTCPLEALPFYGWRHGQSLSCAALYGGWSLGFLLLLASSLFLSLRPLWKLWQHSKGGLRGEKRRAQAVHASRLFLLLAGLITLLSYTVSLTAAQRPQSMRYLVGLLILTPALIWPPVYLFQQSLRPGVGNALQGQPSLLPYAVAPAERLRICTQRLLAGTALALLFLAFLEGTLANLPEISTAAERQQQYVALAATLEHWGVRHVYSGYWICDRLTFVSQEQVICATINPWLTRNDLVRYPPYYQEVSADPRAAYLFSDAQNGEFPLLSSQAHILASRHYRRVNLPGFVLYLR
ncbi:MAG: glycosyltransferase family 39 protein [Thermogemmatispora sp.]|uniref:glycosyltransferase family 39 protein n=1 Tax=Thermogemmatispora sp. TaxID=1968838 RepID=UPI00262E6EE0|nr:glycosyltransferase family 39 protein [Thermogemmatispora sp.]MBX5457924.1 glycosyltransferase family 39 protein [Thermogemmatispora sp.]